MTNCSFTVSGHYINGQLDGFISSVHYGAITVPNNFVLEKS